EPLGEVDVVEADPSGVGQEVEGIPALGAERVAVAPQPLGHREPSIVAPRKITDVKAVSVEVNRGPTPFHDGGFIVPPGSTAPYGYAEILTDEGLTGFCPAAAPPALVE